MKCPKLCFNRLSINTLVNYHGTDSKIKAFDLLGNRWYMWFYTFVNDNFVFDKFEFGKTELPLTKHMVISFITIRF